MIIAKIILLMLLIAITVGTILTIVRYIRTTPRKSERTNSQSQPKTALSFTV